MQQPVREIVVGRGHGRHQTDGTPLNRASTHGRTEGVNIRKNTNFTFLAARAGIITAAWASGTTEAPVRGKAEQDHRTDAPNVVQKGRRGKIIHLAR